MTTQSQDTSGFERRTRAVLEAGLTRIDARTRSRLNRARQAALAAAASSHRPRWRAFGLVPVAGAVAAAVLAVALVLFEHGAFQGGAKSDGAQPSVEVLDMLADDDGIALMENYDHSFYEWAVDQSDAGAGTGGGAAAGDPSDGATG